MADVKVSVAMLGYYDEKLKAFIAAADTVVLNNSKSYTDTSIATAQGNIDAVVEDVGDLSKLNTTSKTDLVSAINEVKTSVTNGNTASAITMTTATTTSGALKSYTLKQGSNTVGVIDIPKDMVVESGSVVTNPSGQADGTYIKLVLANVTDPLYINVGTLIDIYTAEASATQVQLTINSSTRVVSAKIVAGSVTATELASNAVTTAKIADANVTLAKLASSVQTSLGKADSAVQTVATGSTNGTISVDGTSVAVKGLGSAAYTASTNYATATGLTNLTTRVTAEETKSANYETRISALESVGWASESDIDALFA